MEDRILIRGRERLHGGSGRWEPRRKREKRRNILAPDRPRGGPRSIKHGERNRPAGCTPRPGHHDDQKLPGRRGTRGRRGIGGDGPRAEEVGKNGRRTRGPRYSKNPGSAWEGASPVTRLYEGGAARTTEKPNNVAQWAADGSRKMRMRKDLTAFHGHTSCHPGGQKHIIDKYILPRHYLIFFASHAQFPHDPSREFAKKCAFPLPRPALLRASVGIRLS